MIKNQKAQVTIFIIAGIIIIGAIILFLLFRGGVISKIGVSHETNPNVFFESCIEGKIRESVEILSRQGGHIENPLHKTFKFEEDKGFANISYLCYTQNYYIPCVNQEPMLIQHLKDEIKNYISEDVEKCFEDYVLSLEKQDYAVDSAYRGFEVELIPKKIAVEIDGEVTYTKTDETSKKEDFKVIIPSRFYELAVVSQEIINQEARFCNFEYLGFMLIYPEFDIEKFRTGDSTTLYRIKYKKSNEEMKFAVRGCVIPPGI